MWDHPLHQPWPRPPQASSHHLAVSPLCPNCASLPQLCISAPSTGQDECFFFKSLVVGILYSSIFWQFWLFFVFKLLVVLPLVFEEAKCIYLLLHLGLKFHILCFLAERPERSTSKCQRVLGDSVGETQKRIPCSAGEILGSSLKCEVILNSTKAKN